MARQDEPDDGRSNDAWIRVLMLLYPRWLRRERGEELRAAYEEILTRGGVRGRGRLRTVLWLVGDALQTGLRARWEGRPPSSRRDRRVCRGGDGMMERTWRGLGQMVRSLARSPGFAATAVLTMGLGIGMNVAIFSVVHSALLRPLPYPEPDALVQLANRYLPTGSTGWISAAEYWEYREVPSTFSTTVPVAPDAANLTGQPEPLRVEGLMVGPDFFAMLGTQPVLGRGFTSAEGRPGQEPVVVLGHGLWQTVFGGDPDVLDRTIEIGGRARRVVGVMGSDYRPLSGYLFTGRREDYFVPLVLDPASFDARSAERHNLTVLGRLAEGVQQGEAESALVPAVRRIERLYPGLSNAGSRDVAVTALQEAVTGPVRGMILLLAAAAGVVLLVACVNVANLLLARAEARTPEIAVRAAMGAGRRRLVRHALGESVVIGIAGGLVGLAMTYAARGFLVTLLPTEAPLPEGIVIGLPLVGFTVAVAVLAGVLAGIVPALNLARDEVFGAIQSGAAGQRAVQSRSALRRALVVGQVAGAVILVSSAALLLRSLSALRSVDAGFDAEDLYGIQVSATSAGYPRSEDVRELYRSIETRVAAAPGIEYAAASWQTPLQSGMSDWPVMPRRTDGSEWVPADPNLVGPDFFRVYDIEVLEGRGFQPADADGEVGPVILNETGARRLFGDESAVGQRVNLTFGDPVWHEVIGVVEDVRARALAQEPRVQTYMTFGGPPFGAIPSLVLNVRTELGPEAVDGTVTEVVRSVDSEIPVGPVRSMEDVVGDSLERERLLSVLIGIFAAVALLLGAVGVYGVVSFSVGRRTREMGLRIAVGARPAAVLSLVVRQGTLMALVGVAVGIVGSLAAGRAMEGFLFDISGTDVPTLAAVAATVLGVA
ncbi:MAG: ABC transporter permease, partial [Longimicrobiales bacterium]|nr:ABC transporter permease [Longimicrobiales bacterium]